MNGGDASKLRKKDEEFDKAVNSIESGREKTIMGDEEASRDYPSDLESSGISIQRRFLNLTSSERRSYKVLLNDS
jgi:hypothetical protein